MVSRQHFLLGFVLVLWIFVLPSCGQHELVQGPAIVPACEDVYAVCELEASRAGSVFGFYGRVRDCSWDLGTCQRGINCVVECDLAYLNSACMSGCKAAEE